MRVVTEIIESNLRLLCLCFINQFGFLSLCIHTFLYVLQVVHRDVSFFISLYIRANLATQKTDENTTSPMLKNMFIAPDTISLVRQSD